MTHFHPEKLKVDAIKLAKDNKALSNTIREQLSIINNNPVGIIDTDTLASILSISFDLEHSGCCEITLTNFNNTLWECIHNDPYSGLNHNSILQVAFENYMTARLINLHTINSYFRYTNLNQWLKDWQKQSNEKLSFSGNININKAMIWSLDASEMSYAFDQNISDEIAKYIIDNCSDESVYIISNEIIRSIFIHKGYSFNTVRLSKLLQYILTQRKGVSHGINAITSNFINHLEDKYINHDFYNTEFSDCATSLARSKAGTIRHTIKMARTSLGTKEDVINHINKTKGSTHELLTLMCSILDTSPFELLDNPHINENGKRHCMNALSF